MEIDAILFDVNGTLIEIWTDESQIDIYRKMRNYLNYVGVPTHKTELRDLYFKILKRQKATSGERHAEFDAVAIWKEIVDLKRTDFLDQFSPAFIENLPLFLASLYRAASLCHKLRPYPGVLETLNELKKSYNLGIVTNAQSAYAKPELESVGLLDYFDPIIVSGDYGYCKPDPRLFLKALEALKIEPHSAVYVGNDMKSDVLGAATAGMKVVYFDSNQGTKDPSGVAPDYVIKSFPELLLAMKFFKEN